jgi:hypothetical protein
MKEHTAAKLMRIGETTSQNEFTGKYNARLERDVTIW